jgi:hypothetical protein
MMNFGLTRTRTRIVGYPNCRVVFLLGELRVPDLKTRICENPKKPTRNIRATRTPWPS